MGWHGVSGVLSGVAGMSGCDWNYVLNDNLYPHLNLRGRPAYDDFDRHLTRGRRCRYCGNMYAANIIENHYNCPTCAGGWE